MKRPLRTLRSGFTLIELLAVMLIIGILATFLVPQIPKAIKRARVTACKANLTEIGKGLLSYQMQYDRLPPYSGSRFHTSLIFDKVWENTEANARRLTCPEIDIAELSLQDLPVSEWYVDKEAIHGGYTAYAGRNMKDYPIRRKSVSGKLILVADDNDPEGNHDTTTLALMGDNSVREYELVPLQRDKILDEEATFLPVGPDSPVEELQALSLD